MAFNQDVFFANSNTIGGTGTATDPFRGPPGEDTWFDSVMIKPPTHPLYIGSNRTLRFGPGNFMTRGIDVNGSGWAVRSGMRMIGSGIKATTLQLSNYNGTDRVAVGMPSVPAVPLDGFEASDFTVDCNYPGRGALASRAIFVFGKHIYIRRLRVINFGSITDYPSYVIQAGNIMSENCVVEECSIEAQTGVTAKLVILLGFTGNTGDPHRFCVARNNLLRGARTGGAVHGITPGCAVGFIAEGNQIQDLSSAVFDPPGLEKSRDIVVRNNYFRNVTTGIDFNRSNQEVLRMIIHDNLMDIRNAGTGISLLGSGSTRIYTALIIRKNIIRNVAWDSASPGSITGIKLSQVQDIVTQYNIINNYAPSNGIIRSNFTNETITDNISTSGAAVPIS